MVEGESRVTVGVAALWPEIMGSNCGISLLQMQGKTVHNGSNPSLDLAMARAL
jgi:hypothetical protein